MITGGTPISGNLHMACLKVVDLPPLLWPVFIDFPPRLWPVFDWQWWWTTGVRCRLFSENGPVSHPLIEYSDLHVFLWFIHMSFKCPQPIPLVSHLCNKGALAQKKAVICHVEGLGCDQIVWDTHILTLNIDRSAWKWIWAPSSLTCRVRQSGQRKILPGFT